MHKLGKLFTRNTIFIIITLIFALGLLVLFLDQHIIKEANTDNRISQSQLVENSKEELYQDIFITLLLPYIQKSATEFYGKIDNEYPVIDPYHVEVISAIRPNGYRTFGFLLKLKATPYIGAHNLVGLDHITMQVEINRVRVEKFEHIESYSLP